MILYRYFKNAEDGARWLEGEGKIYFSPIESFTEINCSNRKDEFENSTFYKSGKAQINGKTFKISNCKANHDIVGNYISCFSTTLSEKLKIKFGSYILKFDSSDFLEFLDGSTFDNLFFKYGKIEYVEQLTDFPSSPFRKLKTYQKINYEEDEEFRILMKFPNQQNVENFGIVSMKHIPLEIDGLKKYFSIL